MMIKLIINNETNHKFELEDLFNNIAKEIVSQEKMDGDSEISLIIIDNKKMQEISKQYKDKDAPTDVLSFPNEWENLRKIIGYNMLGDIFISYEKVSFQAKEYNHSEKREWAYLFAHGILHLLGYDHMTSEEEDAMNKKVNDALKKIGVGRDA